MREEQAIENKRLNKRIQHSKDKDKERSAKEIPEAISRSPQ